MAKLNEKHIDDAYLAMDTCRGGSTPALQRSYSAAMKALSGHYRNLVAVKAQINTDIARVKKQLSTAREVCAVDSDGQHVNPRYDDGAQVLVHELESELLTLEHVKSLLEKL